MYQRRPEIIAEQSYNRLTAIEKTEPGKRGQTRWIFKCECGNTRIVDAIDVKKGKTKSCGCLQPLMAIKTHTVHGMCGTRIYTTYDDMKQRCRNKNHKNFANYGGRGITVCDEWVNSPQAFFEWALANGYTDELTIDRIENNKGYCPSNCRWATMTEQSRNKRSNVLITIENQIKTLTEWSLEFGTNRITAAIRIKNGWDPIDAVSIPSWGKQ